MITIIISLFFLSFGKSPVTHQDKIPVTWTFKYQDLGKKIKVTATASIDAHWAVYSQTTDDNGPVPTAFYVGDEKVFFQEKSKLIKHIDPLFEVEVKKFKKEAVFVGEFDKNSLKSREGKVVYMCCDDEKCLPPTDVAFKISW